MYPVSIIVAVIEGKGHCANMTKYVKDNFPEYQLVMSMLSK